MNKKQQLLQLAQNAHLSYHDLKAQKSQLANWINERLTQPANEKETEKRPPEKPASPQIDQPIGQLPEFQADLDAARVYQLSDAAGLGNKKAALIIQEFGKIGNISEKQLRRMVTAKKINKDGFKSINLAVSLYQILDEHPGLVAEVSKTDKIKNIRDLVKMGFAEWKALIPSSKEVTPGNISVDEYAKLLESKVQHLFPTDTLAHHLSQIPISQILKNKKSAAAAHYWGMKLADAKKDEIVKRRVDLVNQFFARNLDVLRADLTHRSADIPKLNFADANPEEKTMVLATARAYQRIFNLSNDIVDTEKLMAAGFPSAFSVALASPETIAARAGIGLEMAARHHAKAKAVASALTASLGTVLDVSNDLLGRTHVGNVAKEVTGYLKEIPGYADFFGSQNFCNCKHCQSILGPAAYFVDLMCFVDENITQKYFANNPQHDLSLKTRRPELWDLDLTCENTNKPIPYLTIINEVLENTIAKIADEKIDIKDRRVVKEKVYKITLLSNIESFQSPFNLPFEELRSYLQHFKTSLADLGEAANAKDEDLARLRLNLSPEDFATIEKVNIDVNYLTKLFGINFEQDSKIIEKLDVQLFVRGMNVSRNELSELVSTNFVNENRQIKIDGEKIDANSVQNDIEYISGVDYNALDRLHRFVRLWRATGWRIGELDLVLSHLSPERQSLDKETLQQVALIHRIQSLYGELGIEELVSLWSPLPEQPILRSMSVETNSADLDEPTIYPVPATELSRYRVPFFNRLFVLPGNPELNLNKPPDFLHSALAKDPEQAQDSYLHLLQSGTGTTEQELYQLIVGLAKRLGVKNLESDDDREKKFKLNLANLSLLYRHARLSRLLGISIPELFALCEIAGIESAYIENLKDLEMLLVTHSWQTTTNWPIYDLVKILKINILDKKINLSDGNDVDILPPVSKVFFDEELKEYLPLFSILFNQPNVFDVEGLSFIKKHLGIEKLIKLTISTLKQIEVFRKSVEFILNKFESSASTKLTNFKELISDTTDPKFGSYLKELAEILDCDVSLLQSLLQNLKFTDGALETLSELMRTVSIAAQIGISGSTLKQIQSSNYDELAMASAAIQAAFRAKYKDEAEFEKNFEPYRNEVLSHCRRGLVSYLVNPLGLRTFKEVSDLYHYLLLDVELEGSVRTSRVAAANDSIQLYVNRCLMNLEETQPAHEEPIHVLPESILAEEWEWRKNYRLWEANRKVFLYPENYLEPGLRDDKTPLFKTLEEELLSKEITNEAILDSYARYLRGFDELAHLKIVGTYHEKDDVKKQDVLHLFGVTSDEPPVYYYRRVENAHYGVASRENETQHFTHWGAWEKLDLQIPVRKVSPVVHNGQLFVFWIRYVTKETNLIENGNSTFNGYQHRAFVEFSKRKLDGTWTTPQKIRLTEDPFCEKKSPDTYHTDGIIKDEFINGTPKPIYGNGQEHPVSREEYTLNGFEWDQIYPASGNDLFIRGANFQMASTVDLYQLKIRPPSALMRTRDYVDQGVPWMDPAWLSTCQAAFYKTVGGGNISLLMSHYGWRNWDLIVPGSFGRDGFTDLFFYDAKNGVGEFYTTDGMGNLSLPNGQDQRRTWNLIIPGNFGGNGYTDLLFYDAENSEGRFYVSDGSGYIKLLGTPHTDWSKNWRMIIPGNFGNKGFPGHFSGFTDLLFYDAENGVGAFYSTDGKGNISPIGKPNKSWSKNWQMIIPGDFGGNGFTDLLFYDAENGVGAFYSTDGKGNISPIGRPNKSWSKNWRMIIPGDFGGNGFTDLLFYDAESGVGEFYSTDGKGNISLLRHHDNWRKTWKLIVPGKFWKPPEIAHWLSNNDYTDLLFFDGAPIDFDIPTPPPHVVWSHRTGDHRVLHSTQLTDKPCFELYTYATLILDAERVEKYKNAQATPDGLKWNHIVTDRLAQAFMENPIANIPADATIDVVNGAVGDVIVQIDGQAFYLQGDVRDDGKYHLRRLNTSLSDDIADALFNYGLEYLLSIKQYNLEEAANGLNLVHDKVHDATKAGKVDFDGALGTYLREIFFHIPYMIANHLNSQGRFEDAQRWYHFIFDPTFSAPNGNVSQDSPNQVWRYREFSDLTLDTLREQLTNSTAIEQYKLDPFNPHAIARLRLSAYQKAIVMKYVDNLLDWGDHLFIQAFNLLNPEYLREATLKYIVAQNILGQRPAQLGDCDEEPLSPKNFLNIQNELSRDSEFLMEMETIIETRREIGLSGQFSSELSVTTARNAQETLRLYAQKQNVLVSMGSAEIQGVGSQFSLVDSLLSRHERKPIVITAPNLSDQFHNPKRKWAPSWGMSLVREISCVSEKEKVPIFCVPNNERMLAYWDRVEDRLHKLRHSLDIEGIPRQLPLFAPPINLDLLLASRAAGLSIEDISSILESRLPPYRFQYLLEKAKGYLATVQGLGSALLSAIEKRDAEELNKIRNIHQKNILAMTTEIKKNELKIASDNLEIIRNRLASAQYRVNYYEKLLSAGLLNLEIAEYLSKVTASTIRGVETTFQTSASISYLIPQVGSPFAMKYGGQEIGNSTLSWAKVIGALAGIAEVTGTIAGTKASFERREQEWKNQKKLAEYDLKTVQKELLVEEFRKNIAARSLELHNTEKEQVDEVMEFYEAKFSNLGLYIYLSRVLQQLYRDAYYGALEVAQLTEQAYHFERSDEDKHYISNEWDATKSGLLAGERLLLRLQNMEKSFLESNYRELEITQSLSLAQIDPKALINLKQLGKCNFHLPEFYFDLFYPGQYRRRIRAVRLTIPCVTGPYVNVSAKLTLDKSEIRKEPKLGPNYIIPVTSGLPNKSVALSTAQNDAGVFELNFVRDEQRMWFEGEGVVSDWILELPTSFHMFDYQSISDVIITFSYTAKEDGNLRKDVEEKNKNFKENLTQYLKTGNLNRVFSLRYEFSNAYNQLIQGLIGKPVSVDITERHFPYFLQGQELVAKKVNVILAVRNGASVKNVNLLVNGENEAKDFKTEASIGNLPMASVNDAFKANGIRASHTITVKDVGELKLEQGSTLFDTEKLQDILLAVEYAID